MHRLGFAARQLLVNRLGNVQGGRFHGRGTQRCAQPNLGANLAMVRRVALWLLKQMPGKASGPTKRLRAALDEDYLARVLQGNIRN